MAFKRLTWPFVFSLLLAAAPSRAAEMDWRPTASAGQVRLFYVPPGSLLDFYVTPPSFDRPTPYDANAFSRIDEGTYDWRTGVNYRVQGNLAMSVETRRRSDRSLSFSDDGSTAWKMQMKPTEFRLGLTYRWGAGR